jgi:uncharacterized membrane protein YfcA
MVALIRTGLVLGILFLSTFTRSALGFGDALVAMPLLTLVVGVQTATPLVALAASTIAVSLLIQIWRQVNLAAAWRLILATLLGIPFGLIALKFVPEQILRSVLGLLLIAFGTYNLAEFTLPTLDGERFSWLFGWIAGLFGGAFNANGPPVVIYGLMRNWSPDRFRATLQGYFLFTGGSILVAHGLAGLWTRPVLRYYLSALPVIVVAILVGNWANARISGETFNRLVYAFLIVMGVFMFV